MAAALSARQTDDATDIVLHMQTEAGKAIEKLSGNPTNPTTMNPTIGFTNKYYTLWEVSDPYHTFEGMYTVIRQDTTYIQNLSFDLNEAQEKAIERYGHKLPVDEGLRGRTRSFSTVLSRKANPTLFLFGKYKGQQFVDVNDIDYKLWYWSVTKGTDKESDVLIKELMHAGAVLPFKDEWLTLDEFEGKIDTMLDALNEALFPTGFFGKEGERTNVYGEVLESRHMNTMYGRMFIYRIATDEGSYFITGSPQDINVGDYVEATGRIKWVSFWSTYHGKQIERTELKRTNVRKI